MSAEAQLRKVAATLRGMDKRVDNLYPIWPKVGNIVARANARAFATKGASTGKPWRPLAGSTLAQKMRAGWPVAPLVRSGAMKREFTGRPMGIERYQPRQATFGASSQVAAWQQYGTHRNGKRHIPPRLIQRMNADDRAAIRRQVAAWIVKGKV